MRATPMLAPDERLERSRRVFDLLLDPSRAPIDATHWAVVVAHPDDETLACGAVLPRLKGASLVHVTDGAPRDLKDAEAAGFSTARAYAAARAAELDKALRVGGCVDLHRVTLDIPDQEAIFHLVELTHALEALFSERGTQIVLTHAYEGGHPDHDAVACAVHMALARLNRPALVLEMPLYRMGPFGPLERSFPPDDSAEPITLTLKADEIERKARMLATFDTQWRTIERFANETEHFRAASPHLDFRRPPNAGRVLYETHGWGVTAREFCLRARKAREMLARESERVERCA